MEYYAVVLMAIATIVGILILTTGKPIYDQFFANRSSNVTSGGKKVNISKRKK